MAGQIDVTTIRQTQGPLGQQRLLLEGRPIKSHISTLVFWPSRFVARNNSVETSLRDAMLGALVRRDAVIVEDALPHDQKERADRHPAVRCENIAPPAVAFRPVCPASLRSRRCTSLSLGGNKSSALSISI